MNVFKTIISWILITIGMVAMAVMLMTQYALNELNERKHHD